MTKRTLLLVSLFLAFGLATMATSALAQTQWTVGAASRTGGRAEGLAEVTGVVSMNNYTIGSVVAGAYFTITYSAPVVPASALVRCSGNSTSPFWGTEPSCVGFLTVSYPTVYSVQLTWVPASTTFTGALNSSINLTVRVNATKASCTAPVTEQVTAFSPDTTHGMSITPVQPSFASTILAIGCEPALSLTFGPDLRTVETDTPVQVLTCIGVKDVGPYENEFYLNVDEEFPDALTSFSYEYSLDPDATNGTQIVVTFTDVPAGVGIKADDIEPCSSLHTADPNYCLGGTLALGALPKPTVGVDSGTPPSHTVTFVYTVSSVDDGSKENVDLSFKFWSHGPLPAGYSEIWVNVAKGPATPTTDIPLFTGVTELKTPLSVVEFNDCKTKLLFPYITSFINPSGPTAFSHFGTGIDIANTTVDPFALQSGGVYLYPDEAKGSAVPQSGSCTFYLYPEDGSATVVGATPNILAGHSFAFDVGTYPTTAGFQGKQGYAIAICDFQNAHGFAEIYDNYGVGDPTATLGYLADILPDPAFYHRSPAGDGLGEGAIAPVNIDRFIRKLLMYGH